MSDIRIDPQNTLWKKHERCNLLISVGHDYHEGTKMHSTLSWANENFGEVMITLCDTLQRHNHEVFKNLSQQDAYQKSLDDGDAWILRHKAHLDKIPNLKIVRWDQLLNSALYPNLRTELNQLIEKDNDLKAAITSSVNGYWSRLTARKSKRVANVSYESFRCSSMEYIMEETTIFAMLIKKYEQVDVYPGSMLAPFEIFSASDDGIRGVLGSRQFTRIKFKEFVPDVASAA